MADNGMGPGEVAGWAGAAVAACAALAKVLPAYWRNRRDTLAMLHDRVQQLEQAQQTERDSCQQRIAGLEAQLAAARAQISRLLLSFEVLRARAGLPSDVWQELDATLKAAKENPAE